MKFLANENFPLESVLLLRKSGLDIISIGETLPSITDAEVMQFAITENRTILTFDRDYCTLIFKEQYQPTAGVVYFRIEQFSIASLASIVLEILELKDFSIEGYFTVIDSENIRQRKI